jgi:hypothetical protein
MRFKLLIISSAVTLSIVVTATPKIYSVWDVPPHKWHCTGPRKNQCTHWEGEWKEGGKGAHCMAIGEPHSIPVCVLEDHILWGTGGCIVGSSLNSDLQHDGCTSKLNELAQDETKVNWDIRVQIAHDVTKFRGICVRDLESDCEVKAGQNCLGYCLSMDSISAYRRLVDEKRLRNFTSN